MLLILVIYQTPSKNNSTKLNQLHNLHDPAQNENAEVPCSVCFKNLRWGQQSIKPNAGPCVTDYKGQTPKRLSLPPAEFS